MSEADPAVRLTDLRPGTVSLTGLEPGTVAESIALSDAALSQQVAARVVHTFILINSAVLGIVTAVFLADCLLLSYGKIGAADRLVSTNVVLALISATTVQLGGIALLMGKYLFPVKP